MQEDRGTVPGGKLQGLPGTDFSQTPTPGQMAGDVALASAPLTAASMESIPGLVETLTTAAKSHPVIAHIVKTGITGLVGGAAFAKGSKLAKLLSE